MHNTQNMALILSKTSNMQNSLCKKSADCEDFYQRTCGMVGYSYKIRNG